MVTKKPFFEGSRLFFAAENGILGGQLQVAKVAAGGQQGILGEQRSSRRQQDFLLGAAERVELQQL